MCEPVCWAVASCTSVELAWCCGRSACERQESQALALHVPCGKVSRARGFCGVEDALAPYHRWLPVHGRQPCMEGGAGHNQILLDGSISCLERVQ